MIAATELDYFAHRAEREAVLAAAADDGLVAAIHEELSRLYSARLLSGLSEREAGHSAASSVSAA